ncbi:MAG: isoaspartyl peptidase/L-asparaginase [Candidatus Thermoplasmatota archaeon]|jgi:beta-aspartyl-peptidase (threonine type)|nr:isoaspartyl peptidase/L-asparaginase [Candidatus Thermoplasmatota archaeon]
MPEAIPAVVAHGGAGPGPDRQKNVEEAVEIASRLLQSGASAIEAAVEACVVLEDDPVFNAGTGGVFRNDGSVLLDASLHVSDGRMGFVIAMEDTPNPIRVAADLLDEPINGLTGEGARLWADSKGHKRARVEGRPPVEGDGDTVGVIARDSTGAMACATSTGGCSYRPPGRVGDVPLPGCGFWASGELSVAATGEGEAITTALLSYRVSERALGSNDPLIEAMSWGISELIEDGVSVGLIALGREGAGVGFSNTDMPWAEWHG